MDLLARLIMRPLPLQHPHRTWLRRRPRFDPECRECVMGMLSDRAQRRATRTPPNPRNGHPWSCNCGDCAVYWDTAEGTATFDAACRRAGPVTDWSEMPPPGDAPCRLWDTRTCPGSYGGPCGDRPCARFESNDPRPWFPESDDASNPPPA